MNLIGVVTNDPEAVFQSLVIDGIRGVAGSYTLEIITTQSQAEPNLEAFDGVIVIANALSDQALGRLYHSGKPVSLISHKVPDLPIPVVMSNNIQGMKALVKHVVAVCGRRNLVYIGGIPEQIDAREREITFRLELLRYNLMMAQECWLRGDFSPETALLSLRALIAEGVLFDAIVAADYRMAVAAVRELRGSGLDVPGQVAVVGFGDAPEAREAGLTTVKADIHELGMRAVYQLMSQLQGARVQGVTVLSVELMIRETCCPQLL